MVQRTCYKPFSWTVYHSYVFKIQKEFKRFNLYFPLNLRISIDSLQLVKNLPFTKVTETRKTCDTVGVIGPHSPSWSETYQRHYSTCYLNRNPSDWFLLNWSDTKRKREVDATFDDSFVFLYTQHPLCVITFPIFSVHLFFRTTILHYSSHLIYRLSLVESMDKIKFSISIQTVPDCLLKIISLLWSTITKLYKWKVPYRNRFTSLCKLDLISNILLGKSLYEKTFFKVPPELSYDISTIYFVKIKVTS